MNVWHAIGNRIPAWETRGDPRRLWRRYAVALSLILIFIVIGDVASMQASYVIDRHAVVINIAGRQRMLSQRILYFGSRIHHGMGHEDAARNGMRSAVDFFEDSHRRILEGDATIDLVGHHSPAMRAFYFGIEGQGGLDAEVRTYIRAARQLLAEDRARTEDAWRMLSDMGSDTLLTDLDTAVTIFEDDARRSANSFRMVRTVSLLAALAVLLLEAVLIFWPAHRAVQDALDTLERRNRRLIRTRDRLRTLYRTARRDRRDRNQADSSNRAKSAFMVNMNHEMRTPLNGILGMAQLLHQGGLDEGQRDKVTAILASGQVLLSLVNDVLDLTRIESGDMPLANETFKVDAVLRQACESVSGIALQKGLDLTWSRDTATPTAFKGDAERLKQCLVNLLGNAVKFTDSGSVTLRAGMTDAGELRLSVADTGPGIHPDQQAAIFNRFVQGDTTATRNHGGTGLGLAICESLVKRMGGTIGVDSGVGEGATFWFHVALPVATLPQNESEPGTKRRKDSVPGPDHAVKGRILLAEDNAINRTLIVSLLSPLEGIDVVLAENGAEAIDLLDVWEVDLVLMDIQMPVMSGEEAMRYIRGSDAPYADIPIIVLTANAGEEARELYLAAGATDVLTKPLDVREFLDVLDRHLNPDDSDRDAASALPRAETG